MDARKGYKEMAKPVMVKCRYCGKEILKDEAYHDEGSTMYYCSLLHLNSANQKRLKKEQKNYKSVKGTDRRLVTDYIQAMYRNQGIDDCRIPWDLIGAQMKNLLDEHKDWNYSTLYYVLWYMVEMLDMNLLNDKSHTPLDLLPYYVIEAKEYWQQCQDINEKSNAFELSDKVILKATRQKPKSKYKKITF